MVFLQLNNDNKAEVNVEVGFFRNEAVPSLRYDMTPQMLDNDAEALKELFEVAEAHINGILAFDKKYDWDCMATITGDITIEKCCCDDETDNDYFVEFPQVKEVDHWGIFSRW